jgi:FAD/FMN-containing dehydrogenase
VLVAEAGVMLSDIIATFLPRGWFPRVVPGTRFVTLGGAIAADVHGKNHHVDGSFRACVDWVEVMGADGAVTRATPGDALFDWTLGGMGLTGIILRAAIRLRPVESPWMLQRTIVAHGLDAALAAFEENPDAPYSVAWIDALAGGDALGRSLVMLGRHATSAEAPAKPPREQRKRPRVPAFFPPLLNRYSVAAFNALHYRTGARRPGWRPVGWESYFFPLDAIDHWNRLYGRRGFLQFQCVVPLATARDGLKEILTLSAASGQASFLSVLKRFGPGTGRFSFPMEGYTLALDFPANDKSLRLMTELDRVVVAHGGRFYLAKDARLPADVLGEADPRVAAFAAMRKEHGLTQAFTSEQAQRLGL